MGKLGSLKMEFDKSASAFGDAAPLVQPHYIQNADDLTRDAEKVAHLLPDIAKSLINKANDDLTNLRIEDIRTQRFKQADTKKLARIDEKAQSDYNGNYRDVRDVCRGGIYLDDNQKIAALSAVFDWAKEYEVDLAHGARITVSENRFRNPTATGYSSHKLNIAIPIPGSDNKRYHIAELMLYHKGFEDRIATDKKNSFGTNSHESYEKARSMQAAIARKKILTVEESKTLGKFINTCKKIHNQARKEFDLDGIQAEMKKFVALRRTESWNAMDEHDNREAASPSLS